MHFCFYSSASRTRHLHHQYHMDNHNSPLRWMKSGYMLPAGQKEEGRGVHNVSSSVWYLEWGYRFGRLYRRQQLLARPIMRLGDGVPAGMLKLRTRRRVLRSQNGCQKKAQQTYDFFALFDTGLDLWNISLGDIIFLFHLIFAEDL